MTHTTLAPPSGRVWRSPVFWAAVVTLILLTDVIPWNLADRPLFASDADRAVALQVGQIAVGAVQLTAILVAWLRWRQDRALTRGLVVGLLLADIVLPALGIGYFLLFFLVNGCKDC